MGNLLETLDASLASLLTDWSLTTTLLALALAALIAHPILFPTDPDTHPLLLARQSAIAPVRQKNSSAVHRSPEVPGDTPLRSGLGVKEKGAPRWAAGKDGDLRDVWREVVGGEVRGKVLTVLGKEEVVEHDLKALEGEIGVVGKHLKETGVKRVAIYLPNCAEYLMAIFACSFYGLTPILLPYNLPHPKVYELLHATSADALICAAGNLPLDDLAKQCKNLRLITWVVEKTSRHMDWNGVPSTAVNLRVSVWHDVVESASTPSPLPSHTEISTPADVVIVWQNFGSLQTPSEITTFTHRNIVSATSALISALPARQRLGPADLLLPAGPFSLPYVLCHTLAALYTHASLAITSLAEPGVDLALATRGVSPTVIVASAESLAKLHSTSLTASGGLGSGVAKYFASSSLASGRFPDPSSFFFRLAAPVKSTPAPGKLRLILTAERIHGGSPPLSSTTLRDLRFLTRARICYALTSAKVAGAVAQTHVFDYRVEANGGKWGRFGLPLSSVEVQVRSEDDAEVSGTEPKGEIVVRGPAVAGDGKEVGLGVRGSLGEDGTLGLL